MAGPTVTNGEKPPNGTHDTELPLPQHRQHTTRGIHVGGHGWTRIKGGLHIKTAGESGRSGLHPIQFLKIIWKSSSWMSRIVNILWPFVIAALVVHYTRPGRDSVLKFSLSYIAMVPCANLIGFAGQELARKLPHMLGVLAETTYASASPMNYAYTSSLGPCLCQLTIVHTESHPSSRLSCSWFCFPKDSTTLFRLPSSVPF